LKRRFNVTVVTSTENPSRVPDVEYVYKPLLSRQERPVIASNVCGTPYRVKHYANGILVEPSNPEMLAEAMLKLVCNDKLAMEIGKNGKK